MIQRPEYLQALRRWQDKQIIKVITGIRRCGKSTLMELFQTELRQSGVPDSQIIAVNLEDFANLELRDPMKLHAYILERAGNEKAYVFDGFQCLHALRRVGDASFRAICDDRHAAAFLCGIRGLDGR